MYISKDGIYRALRTFIQAALAYIAVNLAVVNFSEEGEVVKNALIGLAVSAVAAGISAVMNIEVNKEEG